MLEFLVVFYPNAGKLLVYSAEELCIFNCYIYLIDNYKYIKYEVSRSSFEISRWRWRHVALARRTQFWRSHWWTRQQWETSQAIYCQGNWSNRPSWVCSKKKERADQSLCNHLHCVCIDPLSKRVLESQQAIHIWKTSNRSVKGGAEQVRHGAVVLLRIFSVCLRCPWGQLWLKKGTDNGLRRIDCVLFIA